MKARLATALGVLCALGMALSCSTPETVIVPPKTPEQPVFSRIGTHILPEKRLVEITAEVVVSGIPDKAKKVQMWVPAPGGSTSQTILEPIVESPASYRPIIRQDVAYNYPSIYLLVDEPLEKESAGIATPLPKEVHVRYTMQVERLRVNDARRKAGPAESAETLQKNFAADLKPVTGLEAEELAAALAAVPAAADSSPTARARAIYDYVVATFEPDDATASTPLKETLAAKRGGALDYAQVTVALMRAAGIPAHIESGIYLPEDRTPDPVEVKERGAWVAFYVSGAGWTACDPYLADRYSELKDYLFAGLSANRVQTGIGPEPALQPPPAAGAPIVLGDALAEADGKPVPVKMTLTFRDVCPK